MQANVIVKIALIGLRKVVIDSVLKAVILELEDDDTFFDKVAPRDLGSRTPPASLRRTNQSPWLKNAKTTIWPSTCSTPRKVSSSGSGRLSLTAY